MATLLEVRGLTTHFFTDEGTVEAVDDVSFIEIPKCDLMPKEADPTATTTVTTKKTTTSTTPKKTTPTTTPVPSTEPPDGNTIL